MNLRQLICHHLYRFHHGYNITGNWKCVKCGHVKSGFKPVYWHLLKKEYEYTTEELLGKESQEKFEHDYRQQKTNKEDKPLAETTPFILIGTLKKDNLVISDSYRMATPKTHSSGPNGP